MSEWQVSFLAACVDLGGALLGEGAFAPGPALWVGKREVAHFDAERALDVRLTRSEIRTRRGDHRGDERVSLRSGSSEWLALHIGDDADAKWARDLVRVAIAANVSSAPRGLPPTGREFDR